MMEVRPVVALVLFSLIWIALPGQEAENTPRPREEDGKKGWSELNPEEQKRLRETLRQVWSDPQVLNAREDVSRSAREYQAAVRDAIGRRDPEAAELLQRVSANGSGMLHSLIGGGERGKRPPFPGGRGLEHMIPPAALERMEPEYRERFAKASEEAKEDPAVLAAIEKMRDLVRQDEDLRKEKLETLRQLRTAFFEAVVSVDPDLKEVLPPPGSNPVFRGKGAKRMGESIRPGPERESVTRD